MDQNLAARAEQEIFDELAELCVSPGYAHAISYFCFRDHFVGYDDSLKGEDYSKLFSFERLIRTEISTLIGLMIRAPRDLMIPDMVVLEHYIERTEFLLQELHDALNEPAITEIQKSIAGSTENKTKSPFTNAEVLREPIFYGAESAYSFQYRDLSIQKYARDEEWIEKHKSFRLEDARKVVAALNEILSNKTLETLREMKEIAPEQWSVLAGFQFSVTDIMLSSGLSEATVTAVVDAFTFSDDGNSEFTALNEFNAANAYPIIEAEGENRILFLYTTLAEALYETPFYWMKDDDTYRSAAWANRGAFTEEFSASRLERVFGADKVFRNVNIWETSHRKKMLGEIDTLVLVGDRAVVVQAKSKKLTIEARKGNDLQLQSDFKAAVQDACDQAVACSQYLQTEASYLALNSGEEIKLPGVLKKIHPVCVVSDHYPALSFQAQQLLSFKPTNQIEQPLVCDVFFLDVVTEFLESPLRFLSYLELRARAGNSVLLSHEIVALSYHLRQNLWLGEHDLMLLGDDLSIDVDIAMSARRDGISGERNPPGILTQLKGTAVDRIIGQIEKRSEPGAIGTGLELLKLSSEGINVLNQMVERIVVRAAKDGKQHDATMAFGNSESGITLHCSGASDEIAADKLLRHSELRKYSSKANIWCGLLLQPGDGAVRFGVTLDYPWTQDTELDSAVTKMPAAIPVSEAIKTLKQPERRQKIGRNELCPCGSGLKYKKCHGLTGGFS